MISEKFALQDLKIPEGVWIEEVNVKVVFKLVKKKRYSPNPVFILSKTRKMANFYQENKDVRGINGFLNRTKMLITPGIYIFCIQYVIL